MQKKCEKNAKKCKKSRKMVPTRTAIKSSAGYAYPPQEGAKPFHRRPVCEIPFNAMSAVV